MSASSERENSVICFSDNLDHELEDVWESNMGLLGSSFPTLNRQIWCLRLSCSRLLMNMTCVIRLHDMILKMENPSKGQRQTGNCAKEGRQFPRTFLSPEHARTAGIFLNVTFPSNTGNPCSLRMAPAGSF